MQLMVLKYSSLKIFQLRTKVWDKSYQQALPPASIHIEKHGMITELSGTFLSWYHKCDLLRSGIAQCACALYWSSMGEHPLQEASQSNWILNFAMHYQMRHSNSFLKWSHVVKNLLPSDFLKMRIKTQNKRSTLEAMLFFLVEKVWSV